MPTSAAPLGRSPSDNPANLTKYQITTSLVVPSLGLATIGYAESNLGFGAPVVVILTLPDGTTRQAQMSSNMLIDGRSTGRKRAAVNFSLRTARSPVALIYFA